MVDCTYSEAGIRGRREFALTGRNLKVSGTTGFSDFTLDVDLAEIAPNFERVRCFNQGALRRGTIYLAVVGVVALLLSGQRVVPPILFAVIAFVAASPAIIILFRFSRLIEVEQFRSRSAGVVVFDIIREKKKASDFDRFVAALRAAVLAAQLTQHTNPPQHNVASGPFSTDLSAEPPASRGPRA
jgi:hypothetical protein